MRTCLAAILTIAVAAWFTVGWIHRLKVYQAEVAVITATLEAQNLENIRVYPKAPGCYSFTATKNFKQVNGNTCEVQK